MNFLPTIGRCRCRTAAHEGRRGTVRCVRNLVEWED